MATSRSDEASGLWTLGVSVFSGRRDPTWQLPASSARRLETLWQQLQPLEGAPPKPPPLGYRGCFASDPAGRLWEAYRGAVALLGPGGREVRRDPSRAFERLVFESAPPGVLPEGLVEVAELSEGSSA
jgi:hypothetical protein